MPPSGTRRAHSHPASFFSAEAHRPDRPREGRFAHRHPGRLLQVLLPVPELGERTLFHVGFQQLPRLLIERGSLARSPPRRERTPFAHRLHVPLDRGEAHPESTSNLALVHAAPLHGLDYLPSEIFRISVHHPMMAHGPSSSQIALNHPIMSSSRRHLYTSYWFSFPFTAG